MCDCYYGPLASQEAGYDGYYGPRAAQEASSICPNGIDLTLVAVPGHGSCWAKEEMEGAMGGRMEGGMVVFSQHWDVTSFTLTTDAVS